MNSFAFFHTSGGLAEPLDIQSIEGLLCYISVTQSVLIDENGVSSISDLSGNGNDATQPATNLRPELTSILGMEVVRLHSGNYLKIPSLDSIPTEGAALIYIPASAAGDQVILTQDTGEFTSFPSFTVKGQ